MTFTIDTEASREEWDAFLEAIEADAIGAPPPSSAASESAYDGSPPSGAVGDPDLIELLSEVWGFQVGAMPHR
jgi:hypothetical protein